MTTQKRQKLPAGKLIVMATPIGNLGDLSPRARDCLEQVPWIACEDTREARKLLGALGLNADPRRLLRADEATLRQPKEVERLLEKILSGEDLALLSDAGTPLVSDPGWPLVRAVRERGLAVEALPGPCAWITAASMSAFPRALGSLSFRGYFPREARDQAAELERAYQAFRAGWMDAVFWHESPRRLVDALAALERWADTAVGGAAVEVFFAKELTKLHERSFAGPLAEVARALREHMAEVGELGEWVFGVQLGVLKEEKRDDAPALPPEVSRVLEVFLAHDKPAGSLREFAKRVSQAFGADAGDVYSACLAFRAENRKGGD